MNDLSSRSEAATAEADEHRTSPRHSFPYVQKIAPTVDGTMPATSDFFEVRCQDLSCRGIAIVLDKPPEFDHLVVALGREPNLSHVTAQVIRVEPFDQGGTRRYVAGCQFTGRASL